MKRFIPLILAILLIAAGCTFKPYDGTDYSADFEPATTGTVAIQLTGSSPANGGNIQDTDFDTGDIEGIIYIYFNDYLNSSAATATNFALNPNGSAGTITSITVAYEKNFRRVKLTGTFANNATYSLKISADGVKSAGGCYIDGNGNGIDDGSPYDDIYFQFATGTGNDWADHDNPRLNGFWPEGGQVAVDGGFLVTFDEVVESTDVVNGVTLVRESDGMNINLELLVYFGTGALFGVNGGDSLAQRQAYLMTVELNTISDSAGNTALAYNDPYTAETPDFVSRFVTESYEGDDDTPPTVWNISFPWGGDFMTINFDEAMDITTLTSNNIKFYADFGNGPVYVPGDLYVRPDTTAVEYSLINFNWDDFNQGLLVIEKEVTDNSDKKWMLDANGNGIGGEEADITRHGYEDSDNYNEWF